MHKNIIYKWAALVFIALLALILFKGRMFLPGFYTDTHYLLNYPKDIQTTGDNNNITVTIREGLDIRFFTRCHHYAFQDRSQLISDKCWIKVFIEDSIAKFSNHTEFLIEDISSKEKTHLVDTKVEVFQSTKEWASIYFMNNHYPNTIQISIPAIKIKDELIEIPAITGQLHEKIRFEIDQTYYIIFMGLGNIFLFIFVIVGIIWAIKIKKRNVQNESKTDS